MWTHYDNLQVSRRAQDAVIRASYRALIQKYHPDRFQPRSEAERITKVLNESYCVLGDKARRARYDELLISTELSGANSTEKIRQSWKIRGGRLYKRIHGAIKEKTQDFSWLDIVFGTFLALAVGYGAYTQIVPSENLKRPLPRSVVSPVQEWWQDLQSPSDGTSRSAPIPDARQTGAGIAWDPIASAANEQPLPRTGTLAVQKGLSAVAPFQIKTRGGANYFVKLSPAGSRTPVLTAFIRGGETLDILSPVGAYSLRYAMGEHWFGITDLFGPFTKFYEAPTALSFSANKQGYEGVTVELIAQPHGNFSTRAIAADNF